MSKDKAGKNKPFKMKKNQKGKVKTEKKQTEEIQAEEPPNNRAFTRELQAEKVQTMQTDYGILEEYKTLREEIQGYIDASNQIYMFIFTAVSAIYLLAYYQNDASFYMITFLVLLLTKCRLIFCHESIIRIGEYIGSLIEPRVPGLNWETKTRGLKYEAAEKSFTYVLADLHYFSYTIMSLVTVVILWESSGWREYEKGSQILMWGAIAITTLIIIILDFGMRFRTARMRENYRKKLVERYDGIDEARAG